MGNHRVASAAPRAGDANQYASEATTSHFTSPSALALRNWPVSTRLIAVIVLALLMGLVFGGLRVASAADSADEFGRVSQLAVLGQQVTGLVQALENERDETCRDRARQRHQHPEQRVQRDQRRGGQGPVAGRRDRRRVPGQHPDPGGHRGLRDHAFWPPRAARPGPGQPVRAGGDRRLRHPHHQHDRAERPDRAGHLGRQPGQRRPDAQLAVAGQGPGRAAARAAVQRVRAAASSPTASSRR